MNSIIGIGKGTVLGSLVGSYGKIYGSLDLMSLGREFGTALDSSDGSADVIKFDLDRRIFLGSLVISFEIPKYGNIDGALNLIPKGWEEVNTLESLYGTE